MIPDAEKIKPKQRGKSDFFSWQLYRYLKKYDLKSEQRIWLSTWNNATGLDPENGSLYIGSDRDGDWIHCRQLRNLCLHGQGLQRMAYGAPHDTKNWVDVTDKFWADYMRIGVCAVHGDYAHRWDKDGDYRKCLNCNKEERQVTVMEPRTKWIDV